MKEFDMITREIVKNEIDGIPDYLLEDVLKFIDNIKKVKTRSRKVHTYKLKGKFDNLKIRANAYE